jgi:hypothetical protein
MQRNSFPNNQTSLQIWAAPALLSGFLILCALSVLFPDIQIPGISLVVYALGLLTFIFHEAGHPIFSVFGMFLSVLGGTLSQLLLPGLFLLAALYRRRYFAASFFTLWIGQSLVNISSYVADARSQSLKLFSPGSVFTGSTPLHDWHYLLGQLGLLEIDWLIGALIYGLGAAVLVASIAMPIYFTYERYRPKESQTVIQ